MSPYTPQTWVDFDVTKPVSAARMTVLETGLQTSQGIAEAAVSKEAAPYKVLNTSLFSGANIDAAVTAAFSEMGSRPGRIILPRGSLEFSTGFPAFNETNGIILEGAGGQNAGATPGTQLKYKGTATRAIDARSSFGFGLRDLQLVADQAGFTGKLVDLSHSIAADSSSAGIQNCFIGGLGSANGFTPVSFVNAISSRIASTTFFNCKGVRGRDTSGDYSNRILFDDCTFVSMVSAPLVAAGQGWAARACTFQQLANNLAAAYSADGISAAAVSFTDGCWFGDALSKAITGVASTDVFTATAHGMTAGTAVNLSGLTGGAGLSTTIPYYVVSPTANTFQLSTSSGGAAVNFTTDLTSGTLKGVWIDFSGSGLGVHDNYIATSGMAVWAGPSSFGIDITGNQFFDANVAVSLGASVARVRVHPNDYQSVTTPIASVDAVPGQAQLEYRPNEAGPIAAAYFDRIHNAGYMWLKEIADPGNSWSDSGLLFIKDNGAGKSQLCVRFATGATQVVATEP